MKLHLMLVVVRLFELTDFWNDELNTTTTIIIVQEREKKKIKKPKEKNPMYEIITLCTTSSFAFYTKINYGQ